MLKRELVFCKFHYTGLCVHLNARLEQGVLDKGVQFIQKPFTLVALARKVREVMDAARTRA